MNTNILKNLAAFLLSTLAIVNISFAADKIEWEGAPTAGLSSETYDAMTAKQLKNAKVVWVNKDYFENHGVDTKSAIKFQELKQKIQASFGYLIPTKNTPDSLFTAKEITVYPDAYGGPGLNGNYGSGRAASMGDFQLKGLGPTNMVGKFADTDHSSGGVGATQAIAEAMWSVILNRETPHGSNQVVALIDTGLKESVTDHISQPRFLVVREDPLRPAHFIVNEHRVHDKTETAEEITAHENILRLKKLMKRFHGDKARSMDDMFLVFATKVAAQWAYLHANLVHHGAVTPSNIDLSGKMLDLSSVSSLPGAMPAMGYDLLPFGDEKVLDSYLLKPFFDAIKADASSELTISYDVVESHLKKSYKNLYKRELLKLTGTPDKIIEHVQFKESAAKLVELIEDLRAAGYTKQVTTKVRVPEQTGTYRVGAILTLMAKQNLNQNDYRQLDSLILNPALRNKVVETFKLYYDDVIETAHLTNESTAGLNLSIEKRAAMLNVDRKALRRNLKTYAEKTVRAILSGWNLLDLQSWMDRSIDNQALEPAVTKSSTPNTSSLISREKPKTEHLIGLSCRSLFN